MPMAHVHEFNAFRADTSANKHFIQAYSEMYRASYDQSNWFSADDVKNIALGKYLDANPKVPIGLANYKYNLIDTNAIGNGQILQIDSMYYDASSTSNPYIIRQTFIASPLIDSISSSSNNVVFNFSPELTFNKSNVPITSLSVNFGDGGSDQPVGISSATDVSINYSVSGYKILKFSAGFSNGSTKITYAAVLVKVDNADKSRGVSTQGVNTCNPTDTLNITSSLTFQGYDETTATSGKGNVKIFYATNGACDHILRKPIIVLDGFDPGDQTKRDDVYDLYLNNPQSGGLLADDLRARGFDIVILNFPTYPVRGNIIRGISVPVMRDGGADYIERNALVFRELINYVNANKQGTEKLIVIGPSMGGLISRYGLKFMEQRNEPHQTKLWISFDSPHKGANIAIGDQWFLDFYASLTDAAKKNRDEKISSVAAKQMLVHHYLSNSIIPGGAPGFRDRFAGVLNNMGFPTGDAGQPFRKIALVDGSLGGIQVNSPAQKGFTFDSRQAFIQRLFFFKVKIKTLTVASAEMYFTPAYGNTINVLTANKPLWNYTIKRAYSPSYTTGFDTAPGGTYPTQQILKNEGSGIVGTANNYTVLGKLFNAITSGIFNVENKFYSVVPSHSFISTKSALAFTGNNLDLAEDISTRSLVCTGETPFDSYYGDFNLNRDHVALWPDAVTWLKKEIIDGSPQPPPVRNTTYSISGYSNICSAQGGYTVNNLPSGATVTWTASPLNIVSISVSNNVATLTPTGNGSITLSATVTISNCSATVVTMPVGVGTQPTVTNITATMSGSCRSGGYQDWYVQATPSAQNATNWHWAAYNTSSGNTFTFQNPNSPSTYVTVHGGGGIYVTYTDQCGTTSTQNGVTIYSPCGTGSRIVSYPNPADKEMNVQYQADDSAKSSNNEQSFSSDAGSEKSVVNSYDVVLYNDKGKILRSAKSKKGEAVKLVTADIPNGNYFLHITEGKEVTKKQIIIQH
ncbi:T9SS type A sorting domain-containing protein [Mucilaginibacter sp.]|uniref:T9SS type A sorting domain-containing protein n=1 Tax=Mucilaginibacter sp. TaxID=1882438 RepID=UPI003B00E1FC